MRSWPPPSLAGLVYTASQAEATGWTSVQTVRLGAASLLGLPAFALLELRTPQPLLRVQRLSDRAIGGGFTMMLAASALTFGSFLLSSLYLQNVLGTGALATGLAFLPLAVALAAGVHVASEMIDRAGVRSPRAGEFVVTAAGMVLLSRQQRRELRQRRAARDARRRYGLGVIAVSVSVAVLTGARHEESGMLSGLNTTGHKIGGSLGGAVLATVATAALGGAAGPSAAAALADGIGDAFLVAAGIAAVSAIFAAVVLPPASSFLPKLRLAPRVALH